MQGDLVRIDAGCTFGGYWSDTGRSVLLGEPSAKHLKYCGAIAEGMRGVEEAIKPGIAISELAQLGIEAVRKAGIPHFSRYSCGHSIGIEMYDAFHLSLSCNAVLEENMVFNVEFPYYELGWGGIQLENTFLVTQKGADRLTKMEDKLVVV